MESMVGGEVQSSDGGCVQLRHHQGNGRSGRVIRNEAGQFVQVLVDARKEAGNYTATWDARGLGSGIYLIRLEAGGTFIGTRKMVKIE